ncbi:MAG: nucleoside deaminase [Patescibacteria group bacterium]
MDDNDYMKEALKEAEEALIRGDWPIGCVIVYDGDIIARAGNHVYSDNDKLAHAEMRALKNAQEFLHQHAGPLTLYTTYEPCPMCFGAAMVSRVKRIVCGIDINQSGAFCLRDYLPPFFLQDEFSIECERGVLGDECHAVFIQGEPTKKLIEQGLVQPRAEDLTCKTDLTPGSIDEEIFNREIALCKKLSKENDRGCCWGKCADCGVLPLLVKLHKGIVIDDQEELAKLKNI